MSRVSQGSLVQHRCVVVKKGSDYSFLAQRKKRNDVRMRSPTSTKRPKRSKGLRHCDMWLVLWPCLLDKRINRLPFNPCGASIIQRTGRPFDSKPRLFGLFVRNRSSMPRTDTPCPCHAMPSLPLAALL